MATTLTPVLTEFWDDRPLLDAGDLRARTTATQALRKALGMPPGRPRPDGQGLRPARPRRRRLPDRHEVGLPARAGRRPALPRGQRRRVRAGHLQGHPADDGQPAAPDRGRDHHRLRDRLPPRLHLRARRGRARLPPPAARGRGGLRGRATSAQNILGSGFDLEITVHAGAGAYICGEETALLDSLEGRRGQPRLKPPFPAVAGLYARPTVVNNVESIASRARRSSRNGADWFAVDGHRAVHGLRPVLACPATSRGPASTRRRSASRCASCSTWPAACASGNELKFWTPGGSSTPIFTAEHLDVPLDFESVGAAGLDARHPRAADLRRDHLRGARGRTRWTEFYAHESCGKCTPCREGTYWLQQILHRLEARPGHRGGHRQAARHRATTSWAARSAPSATARPARSRRPSSTSATSTCRHLHRGRLPVRPARPPPSSPEPDAGDRMTVDRHARHAAGTAATRPAHATWSP